MSFQSIEDIPVLPEFMPDEEARPFVLAGPTAHRHQQRRANASRNVTKGKKRPRGSPRVSTAQFRTQRQQQERENQQRAYTQADEELRAMIKQERECVLKKRQQALEAANKKGKGRRQNDDAELQRTLYKELKKLEEQRRQKQDELEERKADEPWLTSRTVEMSAAPPGEIDPASARASSAGVQATRRRVRKRSLMTTETLKDLSLKDRSVVATMLEKFDPEQPPNLLGKVEPAPMKRCTTNMLFAKYPRFCQVLRLPRDYEHIPTQRQVTWFLQVVEDIYNHAAAIERRLQDRSFRVRQKAQAVFAGRPQLESFPQLARAHLTRTVGHGDFVQRCGVDLMWTLEALRSMELREAELFAEFLSERYGAETLSFFLHSRMKLEVLGALNMSNLRSRRDETGKARPQVAADTIHILEHTRHDVVKGVTEPYLESSAIKVALQQIAVNKPPAVAGYFLTLLSRAGMVVTTESVLLRAQQHDDLVERRAKLAADAKRNKFHGFRQRAAALRDERFEREELEQRGLRQQRRQRSTKRNRSSKGLLHRRDPGGVCVEDGVGSSAVDDGNAADGADVDAADARATVVHSGSQHETDRARYKRKPPSGRTPQRQHRRAVSSGPIAQGTDRSAPSSSGPPSLVSSPSKTLKLTVHAKTHARGVEVVSVIDVLRLLCEEFARIPDDVVRHIKYGETNSTAQAIGRMQLAVEDDHSVKAFEKELIKLKRQYEDVDVKILRLEHSASVLTRRMKSAEEAGTTRSLGYADQLASFKTLIFVEKNKRNGIDNEIRAVAGKIRTTELRMDRRWTDFLDTHAKVADQGAGVEQAPQDAEEAAVAAEAAAITMSGDEEQAMKASEQQDIVGFVSEAQVFQMFALWMSQSYEQQRSFAKHMRAQAALLAPDDVQEGVVEDDVGQEDDAAVATAAEEQMRMESEAERIEAPAGTEPTDEEAKEPFVEQKEKEEKVKKETVVPPAVAAKDEADLVSEEVRPPVAEPEQKVTDQVRQEKTPSASEAPDEGEAAAQEAQEQAVTTPENMDEKEPRKPLTPEPEPELEPKLAEEATQPALRMLPLLPAERPQAEAPANVAVSTEQEPLKTLAEEMGMPGEPAVREKVVPTAAEEEEVSEEAREVAEPVSERVLEAEAGAEAHKAEVAEEAPEAEGAKEAPDVEAEFDAFAQNVTRLDDALVFWSRVACTRALRGWVVETGIVRVGRTRNRLLQQRVFRAWQQDTAQERAALLIQSHLRGHLTREWFTIEQARRSEIDAGVAALERKRMRKKMRIIVRSWRLWARKMLRVQAMAAYSTQAWLQELFNLWVDFLDARRAWKDLNATTIQSRVRGIAGRVEANRRRAMGKAIVVLQRVARGAFSRRTHRLQVDEWRRRGERCASARGRVEEIRSRRLLHWWAYMSHLQYTARVLRSRTRWWRKHHTLRAWQTELLNLLRRRQDATVLMQSFVRQSFAKRIAMKIRLRVHAAVAIQTAFRCYSAYTKYQSDLWSRWGVETIQRVFRGYRVRKGIYALRVADVLDSSEQNNYARLLWYFENWEGVEWEVDGRGNNPLHRAAMGGSKRTLKLCLRYELPINLYNGEGDTPLHLCIKSSAIGRGALAEYLMDHGADLDAYDAEGRTPLLLACKFGRPVIVRELIEREADVTALDSHNAHALQLAAQCQSVSIVRDLLEFGRDPDEPGSDGCTAVHEAVVQRNGEILNLLMSYGAHINIPDAEGFSPLMYAAHNNDTAMATFLLEHGADDMATDVHGQTALHVAAAVADADMVHCLAHRDGSMSVKDNAGDTPVHVAAKNNNATALRALLQLGGDANERNADGDQCAHIAARYNFPDIFMEIVDYDSHIGRRNFQELTPLGVARVYGHADMERLFLKYFTVDELGMELLPTGEPAYLTWDQEIADQLGEWEKLWDVERNRYCFRHKTTGEVALHPRVGVAADDVNALEGTVDRAMRRRMLMTEGTDQVTMHDYKKEYEEVQVEIQQMAKEHRGAIVIQKFARRKLGYMRANYLRRRRDAAIRIQMLFKRRRPWKRAQWRRRLKLAAIVVQRMYRGYCTRIYYQQFVEPKLVENRAARDLAYYIARMWQGYKARRFVRQAKTMVAAPKRGDKEGWSKIIHQSARPTRKFAIFEEYTYPGTLDVKYFRNSVTNECAFEQPVEWQRADHRDMIELEEFRMYGFTKRQVEAAIKLQTAYRGRVERRRMQALIRAQQIMRTCEDRYLAEPNSIVARMNYVLYVHTVRHDYDRCRTLYADLLRRMEHRGPDNAFILYAYAIFSAVTFESDWTDILSLVLRAKRADIPLDPLLQQQINTKRVARRLKPRVWNKVVTSTEAPTFEDEHDTLEHLRDQDEAHAKKLRDAEILYQKQMANQTQHVFEEEPPWELDDEHPLFCLSKFVVSRRHTRGCFVFADLGFFRAAAVEQKSAEAWHNYALCRYLVFADYEGALGAFIQALQADNRDERVRLNFDHFLESYHGDEVDTNTIMRAYLERDAQRDADRLNAERERKIRMEHETRAATQLQRWAANALWRKRAAGFLTTLPGAQERTAARQQQGWLGEDSMGDWSSDDAISVSLAASSPRA